MTLRSRCAPALLVVLVSCGGEQAARPNILLVFTDNHASHAVSAYGSVLNQTLNIDRLAREGMLFRNAFVTNSICAPSRATVLTGQYGHLNGVPTKRIIFLAYVIIGFFCGLAGFLLSARLSSAEAVAGLGLELTVIASVVIGGTSLFGGIGSIFGTVVGACLIGVLTNGLVLLNVSSFVQQIIIGIILVSAVAFDQFAADRRLA